MLKKFTKTILSAVILSIAAGCGGGGSGDVVVPVKNVPLAVSAASSISLQSGTSANFKITGGGSGSTFVHYSASSSNNSAAIASISGDVLTVTAKSSGFGKITVLDSASNSVNFDFIITAASSPLAFRVNVPTQLTLDMSKTSTYEIVGGVLPYSAAASNGKILSAQVQGSKLILNGLSAGSANAVVFDGVGTSFTINTLVVDSSPATTPNPVALYSTAPSSFNLKPLTTASYLIGGGTPPYVASSSNSAVAGTRIQGTSFEVNALASGTSELFVTDSKGASLKFTVMVDTVLKPFFTTMPASINLSPNSSATYNISGGTPPYIASSSNNGVITASVTGDTLRINSLVSGNANVVVFDAEGKTLQSVFVVSSGIMPFFSTAPSSIVLKGSEIGTYQVSGGKAPFTAVSANTSVATASINGTELQIAAKGQGTASIVIRDAIGSTITISVTAN